MNYLLLEPDSGFMLRIRLFPNFRCSVVKLNGKLFIPMFYDVKRLVMIGLERGGNELNAPHFFVFKAETINKIEPYGNLQNEIVVGIKCGKLQMLRTSQFVIESPAELPLRNINELFADAAKNPAELPTKEYKYISADYKWCEFCGWKNIHCWTKTSNYLNRRIHGVY